MKHNSVFALHLFRNKLFTSNLISVDTPGFRPVRIRTGRPTCEDPDNYDVDHEFPEVSIRFVLFYWLFVRYDLGLVLLAIHKNWNESICTLDISEYWLGISLCRYGFNMNHHIRFLGLSRGQLLKMPLMMTTVVLSSTLVG